MRQQIDGLGPWVTRYLRRHKAFPPDLFVKQSMACCFLPEQENPTPLAPALQPKAIITNPGQHRRILESPYLPARYSKTK
jgi:hypothetical protein